MQILMDISHIKSLYKTSSWRADTDSHITRGHTFVISVVERTRCRRHRGSSHSAGHWTHMSGSPSCSSREQTTFAAPGGRGSHQPVNTFCSGAAHMWSYGAIFTSEAIWIHRAVSHNIMIHSQPEFIQKNFVFFRFAWFYRLMLQLSVEVLSQKSHQTPDDQRQLHQHKSSVLKLMFNLRVGR